MVQLYDMVVGERLRKQALFSRRSPETRDEDGLIWPSWRRALSVPRAALSLQIELGASGALWQAPEASTRELAAQSPVTWRSGSAGRLGAA